jgi:hypothetical protein
LILGAPSTYKPSELTLSPIFVLPLPMSGAKFLPPATLALRSQIKVYEVDY